MQALFGKSSEPQTLKDVLRTLQAAIRHDSWFIAGSYAVPEVKNPGDIDIFFLNEEACEYAIESMKRYASDNGGYGAHSSDDADSFYLNGVDPRIQLIKRHTGTVQEVLGRFDLNVCKRAILPDGKRTAAPGALGPLRIDSLTHSTFKRYFKYMHYLKLVDNAEQYVKELIDRHIDDSTIVEGFYEGKHMTAPVNKALLDAIKLHELPDTYAYAQAKLRAPELLI